MKKQQKRIWVLNAIRDAIDDYFYEKHPTYCCDFCNNCNRDTCNGHKVFVTLFDKNHKRIAGNWYNNCQFWYDSSNSSIINNLSYNLNIDIDHFMWGSQDELLHKVRYITIGSRAVCERADGTFWTNESGRDYDLFRYISHHYQTSWEWQF